MIFSSFFNLFLITVFAGFSFAFKKYFLRKEEAITNLDLLYGFIFLIFLALVINFFSPLKYFFFGITLVGFSCFIYALKKKKIKINFLYHLIILFILTFVVYENGENVDTPMYHLQVIKWLQNEKIVFGLSNLEIRFGSSSLWFNLLAIFKFRLNDFTNVYVFNLIPFSVLIYQIFEKKNRLSFFFIILSISFLLFFSFLHPFNNGVILNHLHNTELDTVAMVFFILSFYLFLKFYEDEKIETLRLLIVSSSICILIKISYIGLSIILLYSLLKFYKKNLHSILKDKVNIFLLFIILFWFIKNYFTSGCLIFPVTFTCLNPEWAPNFNEIEFFSNEVKGYARDTRDRLRYTDFEYTIRSLDWFIPWFKDYALNTSLLKISFFVSFFSIILLTLCSFVNLLIYEFNKKIRLYAIICILFIPNFYIWFQAPEIRFGWGTFISFSCFFAAILLFHFKLNKFFNLWFYQSLIVMLFSLLIYDNRNNLSIKNLHTPYIKNIDYSKIIKIKNFNGYDVYRSKNWKCYDFKKICVNSEKEKYEFKKNYSYLIIKSNFN